MYNQKLRSDNLCKIAIDNVIKIILISRREASSKKAVYAVLFGNLGIAVSKLVAAFLTGSTSMRAETYHSFSDTLNQILLLKGIRTSKKKVSERDPFVYGKEQFF